MSGTAPLAIRHLADADWALLRDIRLRALADAPWAFGSTHAKEALYDEITWRRLIAGHRWFVAVDDGEPVGVVAGGPSWDGAADERDLISMWVEPHYRRKGIARTLLAAVLDWVRADGGARCGLWVTDANESARSFYMREGFVLVRSGTLERDATIVAHKLVRPL